MAKPSVVLPAPGEKAYWAATFTGAGKELMAIGFDGLGASSMPWVSATEWICTLWVDHACKVCDVFGLELASPKSSDVYLVPKVEGTC